jgi:hypothetical protein
VQPKIVTHDPSLYRCFSRSPTPLYLPEPMARNMFGGHPRSKSQACQTASNLDPGSARKRDPSPTSGQACPGSEQEGPARVAQCPHERRSGARGKCLVWVFIVKHDTPRVNRFWPSVGASCRRDEAPNGLGTRTGQGRQPRSGRATARALRLSIPSPPAGGGIICEPSTRAEPCHGRGSSRRNLHMRGQASIALRHRNLLPLPHLVSAPVLARSFPTPYQ